MIASVLLSTLSNALRLIPISAMCLALCILPASAQKEVVVSGVDQNLLEASLDPSDMKIVLEHLLNTAVFGSREFPMRHEHITYSDEEALISAIKAKSVDMFVMFTTRYLHYRHLDMEPAVCLSINGTTQDTYVILGKSSGPSKLEDYRGQKLIIYGGGPRELVDTWLKVELARAGLPAMEDFFGEITRVSKVSKAVTPVYFGKAPLCLIHEEGLEAMATLNPQIKKRLRPIVVSPPLLQGLLCMRKSLDPEKRKHMIKGLLGLNTSIAGAQILRLAKVESIIPVREKDLASTELLFKESLALESGGLTGPVTHLGSSEPKSEIRAALPVTVQAAETNP